MEAFSNGSTLTSAGGITVSASITASNTFQAFTVAATLSTAVAMIGVSLSGSGATSSNNINNIITSYIQGVSAASKSAISAGGGVSVTAGETVPVDSEVGSGAFAAALVGFSLSVSTANDSETSSITAYIDNATVMAGAGITVGTSTTGTITSNAKATSIALALGGAGAGATVSSTSGEMLSAYVGTGAVLSSGGAIAVQSMAAHTVSAETLAFAVSLVAAVGVSIVNAAAQDSTRAHMDGVVKTAASLSVTSAATESVTGTGNAVAGALLGAGAGANSGVMVKQDPAQDPTVQASLGSGAVSVTNDITINAQLGATATATADGAAYAGAISAGGSVTTAMITPVIQAFIAGGAVTSRAGNITVRSLYNLDPNNASIGTGPNATSHASSAAILAAVSGATATASATPSLETSVGNIAVLSAAKDINLLAQTSNSVTALSTGLGAGLIGVGKSTANATGGGTIKAHLDGSVSGAANLKVQAFGTENVSGTAKAVSGGLGAGTDNHSTTTVSPTLNAFINNGSSVNIAGNLTVLTEDNPDGDALTKGVSGGGISVGASVTAINITPTVNSYIGTAPLIQVGGSVSVTAHVIPKSSGALPDYSIKSVNVANGTLEVDNNGLQTGDVVLYNNGANVANQTSDTPIGGLVGVQFALPTSGSQPTPTYRTYGVISVDQNDIALGSQFTGNDVSLDLITFASPHYFQNGDAVQFAPDPGVGGINSTTTYYVRVIDPLHIKLATSQSQALIPLTPDASTGLIDDPSMKTFSAGQVSGTQININNSGFTNGEVVTYHSVAPTQFTTGGVNANAVQVIDPDTKQKVTVIQTDSNGNPVNNPGANNIVIPGSPFTAGEIVLYERQIVYGNIQIANNGLKTGDVVKYSNGGGPDISGLVDAATYNVISIDPNTIELATSAANATQGLGITLSNPGGSTTYTLTTASNKVLSFQASNVGLLGAIGGLTSGQTYRVAGNVNANQLQLESTLTSSGLIFNQDPMSKVNTITRTDGGNWIAGGFAIGQSITVSNSMMNNGSFTITGITPTVLTVSQTVKNESNTASVNVNGNNILALTPIKATIADRNVTHTFINVAELPIGGLTSDQSYYVVNASGSGFGLSLTKGGSAIPLSTVGLSPGSMTQQIGPQGIDLSALNGVSGTLELHIQLTSSVIDTSKGPQMFLGPGGVSLGVLAPPPGNGISTATSQGSGGGFVGVNSNMSTVTETLNVSASDSATILTAGGNVAITTDSMTSSANSTTNGTGGFVAVGRSDAVATVTNNNAASVGANATIVAGGNFMLTAETSNNFGTVSSDAEAGGFAADVRANSTATDNFDTTATVGTNACIAATGNATVAANSDGTGYVSSYADGRGFGGGGYANSNLTVPSGMGQTETDIMGGANVSASPVER